MVSKHLSVALLGAALTAMPALAQTNQPAGPMPAPSAGDRSFGAIEPARVNTGSWLTQEQPGQWRASSLEGLDVYNQDNEKIGDISELIVDGSGRIQAVIVGIGGFLGMGERDVAIPMDQIRFVNEPRAAATAANGRAAATDPSAPAVPRAPATTSTAANNPDATNRNAPAATGPTTDRSADAAPRPAPDHAVLTMNMTNDQLKAAPEFKYAR
jgi:sporulation protein YlmC with PRC-barrel domain